MNSKHPKTMKPRNKKQQHIVDLSGRLRPLTTPQMNWALNSTINHYGYRLKSGMCTCMKCGHEWLESRNGMCLCPECGTQLEIKDTKERVIRDKSYFNVITTIEGYQVIRMFLMIVEMRKGLKAKPAFLEIGSYWIDCKGNTTVVGLQGTLGYYIDSFAFGSPLEIRRDNDAFRHISDEWVYPRIKVTDTIKRNGFKGSCHHIHPVTLFQELLTNPKAETLMKANEIELLRYLCYRPINKVDIEDYWNSIKIANRNGYKVNNSQMWIDTHQDVGALWQRHTIPKYVCPANLQEEHDRYVRKLQTIQEKEKKAEDIRKAQEREASFKEQKEKFFGIRINDGEIEVKVLESVEEYRQEAESQHICLFSAAYDQREDSLIFSARIDGRIIETIEVDLRTLKVVQSRGVCNQNTEYHDRIIRLINANTHLIKERITA
ncbi:PcfJ-like protein [Muribaculum gordoncarteri]|uniref:PcfJ-like protein n=2 Tax=Muribaculum gordoncarteri TaxID=2530390 RepID=A0A4P7VIG6_9BACT|nr:PcfJ-like protein [Muribaculum gordoncarteri]